MTRFGWLMVGCALAVIVLAFGAYRLSVHEHAAAPASPLATTTPANPDTLSIYTNGQYGFSFSYPEADSLQQDFAATSSREWRVNATATGTPIAWVTDPAGSVRVGASAATAATKTCAQPAPAESPLSAVSIGSTTWSAFTFDRVGTDNETRVTSYRTLHDGSCVALEVIEPLAAAQADGSTSPALLRIIQSFAFARP